ncbi:uncharacterized protein LOC119647284 isoform X2 [Hermetia illucens]|uniref:uncharacterized protein LOC119647284 isoform X2 n=1 Tax=Hermetia illucens TaxID=343691 RepID=UPI0018CBF2B9|nr:uncharacterized protein LOC119647284 isoform X2 [Hermetia illucens]
MNVPSQLKRRTRRTSEHHSTSRTSEYRRKNCRGVGLISVRNFFTHIPFQQRHPGRSAISGCEARRDFLTQIRSFTGRILIGYFSQTFGPSSRIHGPMDTRFLQRKPTGRDQNASRPLRGVTFTIWE